MKAILKFDLPAEQQQFDCAMRAADMASALWEITQKLREIDKYGSEEAAQIDNVRQAVYDILFAHNIDIDRLWY